MKNLFLTVLAIIVAMTLFIYEGPNGKAKDVPAGAGIGQRPVTSSFADLAGGKVTLPLTDGSISIINIWATWCPPCREEMPELEAFYRKNKDKVKFFAVNHQEGEGKIKAFMGDNQYTFPVLLDSDGAGVRMLATNGIPTTAVLDGKGVVVFRRVGPVTAADLENAIGGIK